MDEQRYEARHLVEKLFQRMKVLRRVATRFDKLDSRFLSFVLLAAKHEVASLSFPNTP